MSSVKILAFYFLLLTSQLQTALSDGDHHHEHAEAGTESSSHSSEPTGTVTTVHTTSGDAGSGGHQEAFSSILSSINPALIQSFASNPQIAQALKSSGIDVGSLTAAKAAADAGGTVGAGAGAGARAYNYGAQYPPITPFFGPYKQLHVAGDFGAYYPIVEKAIIVFGGGILLLLILCLLTKGVSKGGLLYNWGSSISEALSGSASVDVGPFHKSIAGAGAVNAGVGNPFAPTPQLTQRVYNGIDQRF